MGEVFLAGFLAAGFLAAGFLVAVAGFLVAAFLGNDSLITIYRLNQGSPGNKCEF